MKSSPDFCIEWLNRLNRSAAFLREYGINCTGPYGDGSQYHDLLAARVELDKVIEQERKDISRRCEDWFKVSQ